MAKMITKTKHPKDKGLFHSYGFDERRKQIADEGTGELLTLARFDLTGGQLNELLDGGDELPEDTRAQFKMHLATSSFWRGLASNALYVEDEHSLEVLRLCCARLGFTEEFRVIAQEMTDEQEATYRANVDKRTSEPEVRGEDDDMSGVQCEECGERNDNCHCSAYGWTNDPRAVKAMAKAARKRPMEE